MRFKRLRKRSNEAIARNDKVTVFEIDPKAFEEQFYKLSYSVPNHKKFRAVQIGLMSLIPCSGTHLPYIGELGHVRGSKIKAKPNCVRISYEVT